MLGFEGFEGFEGSPPTFIFQVVRRVCASWPWLLTVTPSVRRFAEGRPGRNASHASEALPRMDAHRFRRLAASRDTVADAIRTRRPA